MAKKKRGGRHSRRKIPLAVVAPLGVVAYDAGRYLVKGQTEEAKFIVTGINRNGKLEVGQLMRAYGPVLVGALIHKGASRLGVNRAIPSWIPFGV